MNVFKKFLDFWRHLQIGIFNRVVCARYIFIVICIIFFVLLPVNSSTGIILLLLLLLWLTSCLGRILLCSTDIVHVNFIIFLFTFYFLAVINIYSQVVWLIFKFLSFYLFRLSCLSWLWWTWFLFIGLSVWIIFNIVHIFTIIESLIII